MKYLTFYDSDGKICLTFSGEESIVEQVKQVHANLFWYEGIYDSSEYYFLYNVPTIRPEQTTSIDKTEILANGTDILSISSAPINAKFSAFNITKNSLLEGTFSENETFATTMTGTIRILIEKFPYKNFERIIYAI